MSHSVTLLRSVHCGPTSDTRFGHLNESFGVSGLRPNDSPVAAETEFRSRSASSVTATCCVESKQLDPTEDADSGWQGTVGDRDIPPTLQILDNFDVSQHLSQDGTTFTLSGCQLDCLGHFHLETLPTLKVLRLSGNVLPDIHTWEASVAKFTALTHLDLSACQLKQIPVLSSLRCLTHFQASGNVLTSSRGLLFCVSLQCVVLSHNRLRRVEQFETLQKLEELDVSHNQLGPTALAALRTVAACSRLTIIRVRGNPFAAHAAYRMQLSDLIPSLALVDDRKVQQPKSVKAERFEPELVQVKRHHGQAHRGYMRSTESRLAQLTPNRTRVSQTLRSVSTPVTRSVERSGQSLPGKPPRTRRKNTGLQSELRPEACALDSAPQTMGSRQSPNESPCVGVGSSSQADVLVASERASCEQPQPSSLDISRLSSVELAAVACDIASPALSDAVGKFGGVHGLGGDLVRDVPDQRSDGEAVCRFYPGRESLHSDERDVHLGSDCVHKSGSRRLSTLEELLDEKRRLLDRVSAKLMAAAESPPTIGPQVASWMPAASVDEAVCVKGDGFSDLCSLRATIRKGIERKRAILSQLQTE